MVWHGGSSAGSYLADPTSPIPSHYASIVATSTLRVNEIPPDNSSPCDPFFRNFVERFEHLVYLFHSGVELGKGLL